MARKFILLGLSQVGLTSISDVFHQSLDEESSITDLNLQEPFHKQLLCSENQSILLSTNVFIFVCDLSTSEKIPISLKAFEKLMNQLEKLFDVPPALYILFHKTDLIPDLLERTERVEVTKELFQNVTDSQVITYLETSITDASIQHVVKKIIKETRSHIPEPYLIEKGEESNEVQKRHRLIPLQFLLYALQGMYHLKGVFLLSTTDPEFIVSSSDNVSTENQLFLSKLKQSRDLWYNSEFEAVNIDEIWIYKIPIPSHYILCLISLEEKPELEGLSFETMSESKGELIQQLEFMLRS